MNMSSLWTGTMQAKRIQAVSMTQRVITELERQNRQSRDNLEAILEPEIERLDALQRASERLLIDEPARWQPLAELYGELGDRLRAQAIELEEEISVHTALISALKEDLCELQGLALGSARDAAS